MAGARWRLVGAEAVLKLRALCASGDFDQYWEYRDFYQYQSFTSATTPGATPTG